MNNPETSSLEQYRTVMGDYNAKALRHLIQTEAELAQAVQYNQENPKDSELHDILAFQQAHEAIRRKIEIHFMACEESQREFERLKSEITSPAANVEKTNLLNTRRETTLRTQKNERVMLPNQLKQEELQRLAEQYEDRHRTKLQKPEDHTEKDGSFHVISKMDENALHSEEVEGSYRFHGRDELVITNIALPTIGGFVEQNVPAKKSRSVQLLQSEPKKYEEDEIIIRLPRKKIHKLIPLPCGYQVVASNVEQLQVEDPSPEFPLGTRILNMGNFAGDEVFYMARKTENNIYGIPDFARVAVEERAYWQIHHPLPEEILDLCHKHPEASIAIVIQYMVRDFRYVCSDELQRFLETYSMDDELIMSTLKVGHCSRLSRTAAIYLRQLGVPAVVAGGKTYHSTWREESYRPGFRKKADHAVVIIPAAEQNYIFDPSAACWKIRSYVFQSPGSNLANLEKKYSQAKTAETKTEILEKYRSAILKKSVDPKMKFYQGEVAEGSSHHSHCYPSLDKHGYFPGEACSPKFLRMLLKNALENAYTIRDPEDYTAVPAHCRRLFQHYLFSIKQHDMVVGTHPPDEEELETLLGFSNFSTSMIWVLTGGMVRLAIEKHYPGQSFHIDYNLKPVDHLESDGDSTKFVNHLKGLLLFWLQYLTAECEFSGKFKKNLSSLFKKIHRRARTRKGAVTNAAIDRMRESLDIDEDEKVEFYNEWMIFLALCLKSLHDERVRKKLQKELRINTKVLHTLFSILLNHELGNGMKNTLSPAQKTFQVMRSSPEAWNDYGKWKKIVRIDNESAKKGKTKFHRFLHNLPLKGGRSNAKGLESDFAGFREYEQGDDIRWVDLKGETPLTKIHKPVTPKLHILFSFELGEVNIFDYLPKLTVALEKAAKYARQKNVEVNFGTNCSNEYVKFAPNTSQNGEDYQKLAYAFLIEAQQFDAKKPCPGIMDKNGMPDNVLYLCLGEGQREIAREILQTKTKSIAKTWKEVGLNVYAELTPEYLGTA